MNEFTKLAILCSFLGACAVNQANELNGNFDNTTFVGEWRLSTGSKSAGNSQLPIFRFRDDDVLIIALGCNNLTTSWLVQDDTMIIGQEHVLTDRGCESKYDDDFVVENAQGTFNIVSLTDEKLILDGPARFELTRY